MTASTPSLRADAARNRELILDAARELFAEEGLDVSMRQIAKRAGVSEPTLRRRFTSQEELVAEAFADKVSVYADLADAALENADAAAGLLAFLEEVTRMQLADRGFADLLNMSFPPTMRCEQHRRRAYGSIQTLIAHAKATGGLREDFVAEDIVLLLLAHAGVAAGAGAVAEQISARLRAYLFSAFGLPTPDELPAAPSQRRVYLALLRRHDTATTPRRTNRQ
jgi:AcrR family transcriptional regulator